jgi:hypothetical protein
MAAGRSTIGVYAVVFEIAPERAFRPGAGGSLPSVFRLMASRTAAIPIWTRVHSGGCSPLPGGQARASDVSASSTACRSSGCPPLATSGGGGPESTSLGAPPAFYQQPYRLTAVAHSRSVIERMPAGSAISAFDAAQPASAW